MNARDLLPHARVALRHTLGLQCGDRLTIVWDETGSPEFPRACRVAADQLDIDVTMVVHKAARYRPLREYCRFASASLNRNGVTLPEAPYQAMRASSASVLASSDLESLFSPCMDQIRRDGRRVLLVPYFDTPTIQRLFPISLEEVEAQRRIVETLGALLKSAPTAHVFSKQGTDLHMRLGQWNVGLHTGVASPGQVVILPAGQASHVPDDGTAEGVIVIDRTIAGDEYTALTRPIALHVERGNVVRIEGGDEARRLREFLSRLADERVYHVTELGIGTNPKCVLSGVGAPAEDTHKEGTVSLALGCDTHIGGGVDAPVHIDMTMHFPSLTLGDALIVDAGTLAVSAQQTR